MKLADILHADTNLGIVKVTLIIIGWCMVKNGRGLINPGTLKSGVSHKWFEELDRFIKWFLHADSDGIIFGLTANLLSVFDI